MAPINTLNSLYSYEVPRAIAKININIKYTRIWSDTYGIFMDFTLFMYFLRGKKIRRLKYVTCILIQNMNEVYKMFFLLTEQEAIFNAKGNLNHSNGLPWAAGTWVFSIPSDIVAYFCSYAWGICKCNCSVKEKGIYAKQSYWKHFCLMLLENC